MSTVRRPAAALVAMVVVGAGLTSAAKATPSGVVTSTYTVRAVDGQKYSITNHITKKFLAELFRGHRRHEYLLAWAGDESTNLPDATTPAEPDFLAVIDVTKGARTYGEVVNTVTIDSVFGNEPHHLQYQWHKGDKVFAGGLLSDVTYVFDVKRLPEVRLSGVTPSVATRCGSVPDAYHVLSDGTAYGTLMGGPDIAGPCRYTNGETRTGNGFGGTPGELVRLSSTGRVLAEIPAASTTPEADTCDAVPALPVDSCANPHGMAVREDLDRLVVGDFVEARNLLGGEQPIDNIIVRNTIRIFDITDRGEPELVSVSYLPKGPRFEFGWWTSEPYAPMEVAVTNRRGHKGAFASTTGGAIFYTPDITDPNPVWREVYDDLNAFRSIYPTDTPTSSSDGGSWLFVSPDDRYLYRVLIGGGWDSPPSTAHTGMIQAIDIRPLLAAGKHTRCSVDTLDEVANGGAEPDCPKLVSALPITDLTSGGPHWATIDNFELGRGGYYRESGHVRRIATTNYFVAATGIGGDHRLCMFTVSPTGKLAPDTAFRDEHTDRGCISFDRPEWPHGATGNARPHGILFAVADADVR
jgi:hypothetical protein